MLLTRLRAHLRLNRRAQLSDLMIRFNLPADVLRDMLDRFIQKGQVRRVESSEEEACRTSCGGCRAQSLEFYEWQGDILNSASLKAIADAEQRRTHKAKSVDDLFKEI